MLDGLGIGGFGVAYNNLPKRSFGQREKIWIQNYMGACFQAPRATPGQKLMHHVH